jgi:hypothetical protein
MKKEEDVQALFLATCRPLSRSFRNVVQTDQKIPEEKGLSNSVHVSARHSHSEWTTLVAIFPRLPSSAPSSQTTHSCSVECSVSRSKRGSTLMQYRHVSDAKTFYAAR